VDSATALRAGLAAIGLTTIGMVLDAGFAGWLLMRLAAGVASAWVLIHVSAWSMERLAPLGRPVLGGVVFAGVGAGIFAAGALCAGLMAVRAGSSTAWIALGIVAMAAAAFLWRTFGPSAGQRRDAGGSHRWTWAQLRLVAAYGAFGFGYIIPATFLPVMAKEVVQDPAVFGWVWPAFGAAAALSTLASAAFPGRHGTRGLWIGAQAAMAVGVAAPVFWPGLGGIAVAALVVGGTFMVATMAGLQEARAAAVAQAGASPARLMAAMTAAFAAGQIAGPLSVSFVVGAGGGMSAALLAAAGVLLAGVALLLAPPSRPER
jgi:hypothetical protein